MMAGRPSKTKLSSCVTVARGVPGGGASARPQVVGTCARIRRTYYKSVTSGWQQKLIPFSCDFVIDSAHTGPQGHTHTHIHDQWPTPIGPNLILHKQKCRSQWARAGQPKCLPREFSDSGYTRVQTANGEWRMARASAQTLAIIGSD